MVLATVLGGLLALAPLLAQDHDVATPPPSPAASTATTQPEHAAPESDPAAPASTGHASPDAHAPAGQAGGAQHGEAQAGHGNEAHGESVWTQVGKITNFVILVGVLIYFARQPLSEYIASRRTQVRDDLQTAEAMKRTAAAQMAEMDARLKALPRELDELKARGQSEVAVEEQRIRELAEVERARLLEQARRDIEQQVRLAQRQLVEHAATLAVGVAEQKIRQQITDEDQVRLVERYVTQVRSRVKSDE